jgi:hypothetical protein
VGSADELGEGLGLAVGDAAGETLGLAAGDGVAEVAGEGLVVSEGLGLGEGAGDAVGAAVAEDVGEEQPWVSARRRPRVRDGTMAPSRAPTRSTLRKTHTGRGAPPSSRLPIPSPR